MAITPDRGSDWMTSNRLLKDLQSKLDTLMSAVDEALSTTLDGISEFELLKGLRGRESLSWLAIDSGDQLGLFQRHFLLFHALYRLQQRDWQNASGHVEISPQCIRRLPYRPGVTAMQSTDPLRSYYLDLDNLAATSTEDVKQMLNAFWERYLAGEGRMDALAVLNLKEPVNRAAIEKRYRELAARHHPDRGGDADKQAQINQAVEILRQYYSR